MLSLATKLSKKSVWKKEDNKAINIHRASITKEFQGKKYSLTRLIHVIKVIGPLYHVKRNVKLFFLKSICIKETYRLLG